MSLRLDVAISWQNVSPKLGCCQHDFRRERFITEYLFESVQAFDLPVGITA